MHANSLVMVVSAQGSCAVLRRRGLHTRPVSALGSGAGAGRSRDIPGLIPSTRRSAMARRKKGSATHGWLVLDKPAGMTSTQAVGAARRLFDARKAGHAGTLDPLATGVLPIAFGEATKTVPYAVEGAKHYRFTVRWGTRANPGEAQRHRNSA